MTPLNPPVTKSSPADAGKASAAVASLRQATLLLSSSSREDRLRGEHLGCRSIDGLQRIYPEGIDAGVEDCSAFVARALSRLDEAEAALFIGRRGDLAMAFRSAVLPLLSPSRAIAVEAMLPKFAAGSSRDELSRLPALTARLRRSGLISDAQAFGAMSIALNRFKSRRREAGWREPFQDTPEDRESFLAKSSEAEQESRFMALAEAEDPDWGACAWQIFWKEENANLPNLGSSTPLRDMLGWRDFPSSFNPLSLLPAAIDLCGEKLRRFNMWIEDAGEFGAENHIQMRHLGRYLATAPDDFFPIVGAGYGGLRLMGAFGLADFVPLNIAARVLTLFPADLTKTDDPDDNPSRRSAAWLALAQGLVDGGAAPPKFVIKDDSASAWQPQSYFASSEATLGMLLCLEPTFVDSLPQSDAGASFLAWVARGASRGEFESAHRFADVLDGEGSMLFGAMPPEMTSRLAASMRAIERLEIALATPAPAISAPVRPRSL